VTATRQTARAGHVSSLSGPPVHAPRGLTPRAGPVHGGVPSLVAPDAQPVGRPPVGVVEQRLGCPMVFFGVRVAAADARRVLLPSVSPDGEPVGVEDVLELDADPVSFAVAAHLPDLPDTVALDEQSPLNAVGVVAARSGLAAAVNIRAVAAHPPPEVVRVGELLRHELVAVGVGRTK
jgi:hypothetical protein